VKPKPRKIKLRGGTLDCMQQSLAKEKNHTVTLESEMTSQPTPAESGWREQGERWVNRDTKESQQPSSLDKVHRNGRAVYMSKSGSRWKDKFQGYTGGRTKGSPGDPAHLDRRNTKKMASQIFCYETKSKGTREGKDGKDS